MAAFLRSGDEESHAEILLDLDGEFLEVLFRGPSQRRGRRRSVAFVIRVYTYLDIAGKAGHRCRQNRQGLAIPRRLSGGDVG